MPLERALQLAGDVDLDLVEVTDDPEEAAEIATSAGATAPPTLYAADAK